MKALTLWQPWASLVAIGAKQVETRSWETLYRGPLAIHAAQLWNGELLDACMCEPIYSALALALRPNTAGAFYATDWLPEALPRGSIVATATLRDCIRVDSSFPVKYERYGGVTIPPTDRRELAFGNYEPGRFAWILTDIKRLEVTIPAKGGRKLWEWTP